MISTQNGYWLIGQTAPNAGRKIMERETSNHPGPNADRVNVVGADLSPDQLDALTPEQRTRLTSGEPLPIDPRSPLSEHPLSEAPAGRSPIAVALDEVEGMGDGDGDGRMDHGTASGEDQRETETGATTDAHIEARNDAAGGVVGTPIAAELREPAAWDDKAAATTSKPVAKPAAATHRSPE